MLGGNLGLRDERVGRGIERIEGAAQWRRHVGGDGRVEGLQAWAQDPRVDFGEEQRGAIEDDHAPFLRLGAPAVDLIDFNYGPDHTWWHTEKDTMDKLSARSLEIVGEVLTQVFVRLEK